MNLPARQVVVDFAAVTDRKPADRRWCAVVRDGYQGAPIWHGDFSNPPTKQELSELAYGAGQSGFDAKAVLVPLGKLQKGTRRDASR